jgi:hypothetical protein
LTYITTKCGNDGNEGGNREEMMHFMRVREKNTSIVEMLKKINVDRGAPDQQVARDKRGKYREGVTNL